MSLIRKRYRLLARLVASSMASAILCGSGTSNSIPYVQAPATHSNATGEIALTVTVRDSEAGYVPGLNKDSFLVRLDKTPQSITRINRQNEPMSIGILVDTSGSMSTADLKAGMERFKLFPDAVSRLLQSGNKNNEYFLISFSANPTLLVDYTRDLKTIVKAVAALKLKGPTALLDACYEGLHKIRSGSYKRRALILISDGDDNNSKHKPAEILRMLRETDVLIYSISVVDLKKNQMDSVEDYFTSSRGSPILLEMTSETGGWAFFPRQPRQVSLVFELISSEMQNQYRLWFRPSDTSAKDKWRTIHLEVSFGGKVNAYKRLSVRTRRGIFSKAGLQ